MLVTILRFMGSCLVRLSLTRWFIPLGVCFLTLTNPASGQLYGDHIHGDHIHGDHIHGDDPDHRLTARAVSFVWPAERVRRSSSPASVAVVPVMQPDSRARSTPVSTGTDYATEPDVFIREQRMQRPTAALLNETYRQAEANWSQHLRNWQATCARNGRYRP